VGLTQSTLIQTLHRLGKSVFMGVALTFVLNGCNQRDSGADVVAEVNAHKITRSELDKAYQRESSGAPQSLPLDQERALRLRLVTQLIDSELYLQRASKQGILATDEAVNARVNQDRAPYTNEEFVKKLQDMGYTEDEYRREVRRRLIIEKLIGTEVENKISISDADIQDFYRRNQTQFNLAEPQYLLAQIFVNAHAVKAQGEIPGYQKIRMVHDRLESGGDFAELAQKYSDDLETGRDGGELPPLVESSLKESDPVNSKAILALEPNQYSKILKVMNPKTGALLGYRIVRLVAKQPAGQRNLSDPQVQQFIRNQLRKEREELLRNAYDAVVRDGAEVHNYYANQVLKGVEEK